jgi:hypothetical protein
MPTTKELLDKLRRDTEAEHEAHLAALLAQYTAHDSGGAA